MVIKFYEDVIHFYDELADFTKHCELTVLHGLDAGMVHLSHLHKFLHLFTLSLIIQNVFCEIPY